ncbi:MAG: hypothetical protein C4586_05780 [Anaerolineaceae bacterium]|nr:MAG: hypothetical protein C4586_05780 [Anaerolineaceae bacterium]
MKTVIGWGYVSSIEHAAFHDDLRTLSERMAVQMTYPRIKELGLEVQTGSMANYINAEDLERILEQGVRVYIARSKTDGAILNTTTIDGYRNDYYQTQALMIGEKPIQRDTAESLLSEYIKTLKEYSYTPKSGEQYKQSGGHLNIPAEVLIELENRARKLLEQSK